MTYCQLEANGFATIGDCISDRHPTYVGKFLQDVSARTDKRYPCHIAKLKCGLELAGKLISIARNGLHPDYKWKIELIAIVTKPLFFFACAIILSSCQSRPSTPIWYNSMSVEDGVLLGYGQGENLQEAKQMAFSTIAQQFGVEIESEMALVRQFGDDELKTNAREVTQIRFNRSLKNVTTIQETQVGNTYYVALKVDQRPLRVIIDSKLREKGYQAPRFAGSQILTTSPLLSSLQAETPENTLSASLQREEGQWQLVIADIVQPVEDLTDLLNWNSQPHDALSLSIVGKSENRVKSGERFQIGLNLPTDSSFLTIFNIYSDGRLTVALDNHSVGDTRFTFPNKPLYLQAESIYPDQFDRDTYVAIVTPDRVDTTRFKKSSSNMITGENAFMLHTLIEWLDRQPITAMSALNIEIYP